MGQCATCDWTSPARRARYSVEADMAAHEVLCRSSVAVANRTDDDVAIPGPATAGVAAADVVASGRERLSAQGRS